MVSQASTSMLVLSSASAGVPDEVAHAAEHVMDERPGEQKEHDAPDDGREDVRDLRVGVRPGGNRDEPPGEQDEAGRVCRAEMRCAIDIIIVSIGR